MKQHYWIPSQNKRLSAMVHRSEAHQQKTAANPLIIACHGFTGDKIGANQLMRQLAEAIAAAGYDVLRFDFAGSGESEGSFATDTSITNWLVDLRNVLTWVRSQQEWSQVPVYLLGHSLGGCIILLYESMSEMIAGRIALAPVVQPLDNFRETIIGPDLWERSLAGEEIECFYGKGFRLQSQFVQDLVRNDYQPLKVCQRHREPLLVVHGTADQAVPVIGSERLMELYPSEKRYVPLVHADHLFTGNMHLVQSSVIKWLNEQSLISE